MIQKWLEDIMFFLIELNNDLYNWFWHIIFFILFIVVLVSELFLLKVWVIIGLVMYFSLIIIRIRQKEGLTLKQIKEEPLTLLVGFNLCVWLSLLSFPIIYMLHKLDKKYGTKDSDKNLNE